jgi:hypothetical protein
VRSAGIIRPLAEQWEQHPLRLIIILAVVFRLIAVFFSRGFGWFDDHFLIIEAAQSWVDGHDYNNWLPWSEGNKGPGGHNLFYSGLHYLLFKFFDYIGFTDPQGKMLVVRLLHAALSLAVVVIGYKLALRLGNRRTAAIAGLLLAIFWIFPFISVRNLIEFTCVPFLLWGTAILMHEGSRRRTLLNGFLAGLVLGIAFSMRFQSLVYIGGIGLGLIILGRWKEALGTGIGVVVTAFLLLATIDMYIWGYPFAELIEYVHYNMHNYAEYTVGPWYQYILVLLLLLIPPVSIFLLYGFFHAFAKNWKKYLLIFFPVILFLVFHSYYPNKQERFIIPVIPFIIIAGTVGWMQFRERSAFWSKHKKLNHIAWTFFWVLNTILLLGITGTYSKRARVESMSYLSRYQGIDHIVVENSNREHINLMPMYYLGQWVGYVEINNTRSAEDVAAWYASDDLRKPDFIIIQGDKNFKERRDAVREAFPGFEFEVKITPGMIDRVLFWLNPVNENQNWYIYRNTGLYPQKKDEQDES